MDVTDLDVPESGLDQALIDQLLHLHEAGKYQSAIDRAQSLLELYPNSYELWQILAYSSLKIQRLDQAIIAYKMVVTLNPGNAVDLNSLGVAFKEKGDINNAIRSYLAAIDIDPEYANASYNLALVLTEKNEITKSISWYEKAIKLGLNSEDQVQCQLNLASAYAAQSRHRDAITVINKALSTNPGHKALSIKKSDYLMLLGQLLEATNTLKESLSSIGPDHYIQSMKLHLQAQMCDWSEFEHDKAPLTELGVSQEFIAPFTALSLEDSAERHRLRSEVFTRARYNHQPISGIPKPDKKPNRIRIGYFSSDFKGHPVAFLIAGMLEKHNRDQFEVFGYSIKKTKDGPFKQRLIKAFDVFDDVSSMSDKDVALLARQDQIDIAIDLNGHTQDHRTAIFAYRAAPLQISYLGYPGTMGADFIDYIIADHMLIPTEHQRFFSEKVIYLPNHYQAQDDISPIAKNAPSRSQLGLPEEGFVFCGINNTYKITPSEFNVWMRLLQAQKGSVLWLLESNEWAGVNLKKEAAARGIDPNRLVFAKRTAHDTYLAQLKHADLFLDTFNYNAGATASNALWAGLPVLTKCGESYTARMASSLLTSIGLPELITTSEAEYEARALELANNPEQLKGLKHKLATHRETHPLFDTALFTKHIEDGYQQAYQNYFDDKKPENIFVSAGNEDKPPTFLW